jgi:hypothetical protein
MADNGTAGPTPEEALRRAYEEAERNSAAAMERVVGREGFGVLLAKAAENVVAVTKIAGDVSDLVLRNLRLAGRADVNRLARQLNRTEDKLELVLQQVEALHDELRRRDAAAGGTAAQANGATTRA